MGGKRTSQSGRKRLGSRLRECVGFRVETPAGQLGIVEALRSESGRGQELVVRAGKHGTRFLILLADDVAEVVPDEHRVVVCSEFHLLSSEGLSARARQAATPGG
jgi:hypothetical protein